jgi:hypothetical protein
MKRFFIPTLIGFIFLGGLLIISVKTGIPKSFWETRSQREDAIQDPQFTKGKTLPTQQEEPANLFPRIETNGDVNNRLEIYVTAPTHLLGLVRQYLAEQLGVAPSSIEVAAVEETVWPDSCLGLPAPELCALGETSGYRIIFRALGQEYVYRTNKGEGFRFEGPGDEPRRP